MTAPSIPLDEQIAYQAHKVAGKDEYCRYMNGSDTRENQRLAQEQAILSSLKELQASRLDSARYRWLCSFDIIPSPSLWDEGVAFLCPAFERKSGSMPKEELDAAIDAALPPIADKETK
jgi:hypothetical protein